MKDIKKVLMRKGKIGISQHTRTKMNLRGYTKGDIISTLFNGEIIERQGAQKVAVAGKDMDNNPMIVIVSQNYRTEAFLVVTVMPPIDHNRFKECV